MTGGGREAEAKREGEEETPREGEEETPREGEEGRDQGRVRRRSTRVAVGAIVAMRGDQKSTSEEHNAKGG